MENNVSNEFLCRMLAAYLPCKAKSRQSERVYDAVGIKSGDHRLIECKPEGSNHSLFLYPKDLQMLLFPLSAISDEDAIEVARIITKGYCRHFTEGQISYRGVDESKRIGVFRNGALDNIVHIQKDGIGYYEPAFPLNSICGDLSVQGRTYFTPNVLEAYDFLRSKSYDCGFGEIPSLITAGLAITSLNK